MPFINGKRVSNEEWLAARGAPVDWKEATGYKDRDDEVAPETVAEETPAPTRKRRAGTKKAQAEAALAAVAGLDISLNGDDEDTENE